MQTLMCYIMLATTITDTHKNLSINVMDTDQSKVLNGWG